jgi:hypothetical protein
LGNIEPYLYDHILGSQGTPYFSNTALQFDTTLNCQRDFSITQRNNNVFIFESAFTTTNSLKCTILESRDSIIQNSDISITGDALPNVYVERWYGIYAGPKYLFIRDRNPFTGYNPALAPRHTIYAYSWDYDKEENTIKLTSIKNMSGQAGVKAVHWLGNNAGLPYPYPYLNIAGDTLVEYYDPRTGSMDNEPKRYIDLYTIENDVLITRVSMDSSTIGTSASERVGQVDYTSGIIALNNTSATTALSLQYQSANVALDKESHSYPILENIFVVKGD